MERLTLKSSFDNLEIAVAIVEPQSQPCGIFQISHGMAEHKERYFPFMEFLAQRGFVVVIHDHRGHGESVKNTPDDLGYMYKGGWLAMVEDVKMVQDYAVSRYPGLPVTLFGHSMGSMVVRSFAKRYGSRIAKLIVCGCPSENPGTGAGIVLASLSGVLHGWHHRSSLINNIAFGAYARAFPGESKLAWLSSDKSNVNAYKKDPLCGFCFTASGFVALFKVMRDCYSAKGWQPVDASLPVRFISGANDPCRISDAALQKAAQFMRDRGYADVTVTLLPGLRHEILLEEDFMSVWQTVAAL